AACAATGTPLNAHDGGGWRDGCALKASPTPDFSTSPTLGTSVAGARCASRYRFALAARQRPAHLRDPPVEPARHPRPLWQEPARPRQQDEDDQGTDRELTHVDDPALDRDRQVVSLD